MYGRALVVESRLESKRMTGSKETIMCAGLCENERGEMITLMKKSKKESVTDGVHAASIDDIRRDSSED